MHNDLKNLQEVYQTVVTTRQAVINEYAQAQAIQFAKQIRDPKSQEFWMSTAVPLFIEDEPSALNNIKRIRDKLLRNPQELGLHGSDANNLVAFLSSFEQYVRKQQAEYQPASAPVRV